MAETTQPESITAEDVNLEDLLNSRSEQQIERKSGDKVTDIRFRPLAARADKHQAKIDKQTVKAAKLTDKNASTAARYASLHVVTRPIPGT